MRMLAIGTDRDIYLLSRLVWEDHESRARGMKASSSTPMGKDTSVDGSIPRYGLL